MLKLTKNIILIIALCNSYVFFSIINIFGKGYAGKSENKSFIIFCIIFAAITLLIIYFDWVRHRFRFNIYQIIFLFIPIPIILLFIKEGGSNTFRVFLLFLIFSVVSIYTGIYYAKNKNEYENSLKGWLLLMWLLSIGSLKLVFSYLFHLKYVGYTTFSALGGGSYQKISYILGFTYALNLFFILYKHKLKLFSFCSHPFYKLLSIGFLVLQVLGIFVTGGRGGFVVVIFSSIILVYHGFKLSVFDKKKFMRIFLIAGTIITIIIFIAIPIVYSQNEYIAWRVDRILSYVSSSGIDMKETSGRDLVYAEAISKIKEKPIFGYGIFGHFGPKGEYPHNLFLEALLGGGILYFLFIVFISYVFYKRMIYLVRLSFSHVLLLCIFSCAFVFLMFSGTYLTYAPFWFLGSYVFCYPNRI